MTRKFAILSIALVFLFVLGILAGCGGGGGGGGEGGTIVNPTSTPSSPAQQDGWVFKDSGTQVNLNSITFISSVAGWAAGDLGIILTSTDGGASWQLQISGTTSNLYGISFKNANEGIAVGEAGTILRTINGGLNWDEKVTVNTQVNGDLNGVIFQGTEGWIIGDNGLLLHTSDSGVNWELQDTGLNIRFLDVSFIDSLTGWIVGENGTVIHTTDGGKTWNLQFTGVTAHLNGVSFVNNLSGWAAGDKGTIISTNDGGQNWNVDNSGTSIDLADVFFVDVNNGWIVGKNGTILSNGASGETGSSQFKQVNTQWKIQPSGTTVNLLNVFFINPNLGFIVGETGIILITINGGQDPNTPTNTPTSTPTSTPTGTPTSTPTNTPPPNVNPTQKYWRGALPIDGSTPSPSPSVSPSPSPTQTQAINNQLLKRLNPLSGVSDSKNSTVSKQAGYGNNHDITLLSDNTAVAVFTRYDGSYNRIYSNIFSAETWHTPVLIDAVTAPSPSPSATPANSSHPRVSSAGTKAVSVFTRRVGSYDKVFANIRDGVSWSGTEAIDNVSGTAGFGNSSNPEIAVSADGSAVAVYLQVFEGTTRAYASRLVSGSWTSPQLIDNAPIVTALSSYTDSSEVKVAIDPTGKAVAVFRQNDTNSRQKIFANYFNGTTWSGPVQIDDPSGGSIRKPAVAMGPNGKAYAAFVQHDGSNNRIYANYFNGTAWQGPQIVDANLGYGADNPDVATGIAGQALIVFQEYDGDYNTGYSASGFNGTFQPAQRFDPGYFFDVGTPKVAFDRATGDAIVVFEESFGERLQDNRQSSEMPGVYANHWNGLVWKGSVLIDDGGYAFEPDIAYGSNEAFAIFRQYADGLSTYANRYK